jgi:hypothetical protein
MPDRRGWKLCRDGQSGRSVSLGLLLGDDDRDVKPPCEFAEPPDSIDEIRTLAAGELLEEAVLCVDDGEHAVIDIEQASHVRILPPGRPWLDGTG